MANELSPISPSIFIHDGLIVTTSLSVAKFFNKQHKNVIQRIESLNCSDDFTSANFSALVQKVNSPNGATRNSKYYEMTKDGFIFLVMGFTGKKAALLKEAYINAFNQMAQQLTDRTSPLPDNVQALTELDKLKYIDNIREKITLTFNSNEITQLNALFETVNYLNEECWPALNSLFPNFNPKIEGCFKHFRLIMALLRKRRTECRTKATKILSL